MTDATRITVYGHPAPQGSKRAFRNQHTGRIQQVENSAKVAPWRQDVRNAIEKQAPDVRYDGAVAVRITFAFERPRSHYRTGRNADLLRAGAPRWPTGRTNDVDKLARSTLDALTSSGVIVDDGQVIQLVATKVYVDGPTVLDRPGAIIRIERLVEPA